MYILLNNNTIDFIYSEFLFVQDLSYWFFITFPK